MVRVWAFVIAIFALLGFAAWASDFITMQGERTIYTVECHNGAWAGDHCVGSLVAGERYRYRALPPHSEVIFWTVGSNEPSGKFGRLHDPGRAQLDLQAEWRCAALDHLADGRRRSHRRSGDPAVPCRLEMALDAPASRLVEQRRRAARARGRAGALSSRARPALRRRVAAVRENAGRVIGNDRYHRSRASPVTPPRGTP